MASSSSSPGRQAPGRQSKEILDGEVLASAGLKLVDAPSSSSEEPEEEWLLLKLMSLYRARQVKLAS